MNRSEWFRPRWKWLQRFALAALAGVALSVIAGMLIAPPFEGAAVFIGAAAIVPLIFWLSFIPIMHWKDRYRGRHPWLWGALMVFETSGWTRLFYWFMHVLPDQGRRGNYESAE